MELVAIKVALQCSFNIRLQSVLVTTDSSTSLQVLQRYQPQDNINFITEIHHLAHVNIRATTLLTRKQELPPLVQSRMCTAHLSSHKSRLKSGKEYRTSAARHTRLKCHEASTQPLGIRWHGNAQS